MEENCTLEAQTLPEIGHTLQKGQLCLKDYKKLGQLYFLGTVDWQDLLLRVLQTLIDLCLLNQV